MPRPSKRLEWLQAVVAEKDRTGCRDWPFARDPNGYPRVGWKMATHLVLELDGRPRPNPPSHFALHSCDRPCCAAPWHLRWGTCAENMREAAERGRMAGNGGVCGNAVLTEADVLYIRSVFQRGNRWHGPGNRLELARQFGVSKSAITRVVHEHSWNRLSPAGDESTDGHVPESVAASAGESAT